jgi:hypothetical protein
MNQATHSALHIVFLIILLLPAVAPVASAQALIAITPNTGETYGIAAWYSYGWQDPGTNTINGYGVNLKYGRVGFFKYDDTTLIKPCDECEKPGETKEKKVKHTRYWLKMSFALGYLTYYEIDPVVPNIQSSFDLTAPYAGVFFSIPFGFPTKKDESSFASMNFGYTSGVFSAPAIKGKFTVNGTTAEGSFLIPSTLSHEFNIGVSLGHIVFLNVDYHILKPTDILYTSRDDAVVKTADLERNFPEDLNLSFWAAKVGVSVDF